MLIIDIWNSEANAFKQQSKRPKQSNIENNNKAAVITGRAVSPTANVHDEICIAYVYRNQPNKSSYRDTRRSHKVSNNRRNK